MVGVQWRKSRKIGSFTSRKLTMLSHLSRTPTCDRHRRTDGQTQSRSIYCASIASRGIKNSFFTLPTLFVTPHLLRTAKRTQKCHYINRSMQVAVCHTWACCNSPTRSSAVAEGPRNALCQSKLLCRNVAQMFVVELHLKSLATGEWPSRSLKVTGNGMNR